MTIRPRKTLTSQKWLRRNDSSSVSILLKPDGPEAESASNICNRLRNRGNVPAPEADDSDDEQPRRTILSAPLGISASQHKIYKTFCPDCYCKSFPVAPCMGRPRDSCCCQLNQQNHNYRSKTAMARSKRIKSAPQSLNMNVVNLTQRREHYEINTKDYFTDLKQRLAVLERELKQEQEEIERKATEYRRMQQQQQRTCTKFNHKSKETKIKDVMAFRKSHYFACHSSATSLGVAAAAAPAAVASEHPACTNSTCTHKCYLDNDFKLHPEHSDEYGTSRCVHCQRALSQETLSHPPATNSRSLIFAKASLENLNLLPLESSVDGQSEAAESVVGELQDKMFLTTRNNEKLEVTLPHNFLHEAQKPITLSMLRTHTFRNFRMPLPADSMALRYQKGMRNKIMRNK